jgi:2-polyprenyl-3-methyl-5-hydroxy-6-metoxy-1,4-benzoquinol methylase
MTEYVLPHHVAGERQRLALMSALLDPAELAHIAKLGARSGWRCLELGCSNGSISRVLADHVAPGGHVVASDLDVTYFQDLQTPCLEIRQLNILEDAIEEDSYDLVVSRALLHHLSAPRKALQRMTLH